MLFAARAGQGLGAAMLSPAALSIIVRTFAEGRERTRALGAWGALVYAFSQAADAGWTSAATLATGAAGLAALAAFCGAGAASAELREGRVPADRVEAAVVATVLGAVSGR
jgi:MFS family permease